MNSLKDHQMFALVATVLSLVAVAQSTCPPDNVVEFVAVPEENYDRNYSRINEEGKRPLGFDKSVWYYNQPGMQNPCIKITGATDRRRVEIMVQAANQARLCFKTQTSTNICFFGNQWRCISTGGEDDIYVEFFCDEGCEEQDVLFWYRIVVGTTIAEDSEDHWCENRQQDQFPDTLLTLPPGYVPEVETTTPFNSACKLNVGAALFLMLLSIFLLCLMG